MLEKAISICIEEINMKSNVKVNFMHIKKDQVKLSIYGDLKNFNTLYLHRILEFDKTVIDRIVEAYNGFDKKTKTINFIEFLCPMIVTSHANRFDKILFM